MKVILKTIGMILFLVGISGADSNSIHGTFILIFGGFGLITLSYQLFNKKKNRYRSMQWV
jgi:hypothetical protein